MRIANAVLAAAVLLGLAGCSEQTKIETKEAINETGEAVRSAAQDTAENVEGAARRAQEKLAGDSTEPAPATEPAPSPAPGNP
jgi:uncharacterized lipoprotein